MAHVREKVFVGLSGGVDSSVGAALLKDAGYDVEGVFIKVWQPDFMPCTASEERRDAMRVCAQLDIPFTTVDFQAEYKRDVVEYMVSQYKSGKTPNPDVMCNRYIKFGAFLHYAKTQGARFVATGHYALNVFNESLQSYELHAAADTAKDQTYFLWTLTQRELSSVLFPIGHLQKRDVRARALMYNLETASKKDSQGLCFLGKLDLKDFLGHFLPPAIGPVVDEQGHVVGEHAGAHLFTIGQRHGFTLTEGENIPHYVIAKDTKANTITVGKQPAKKDAQDAVNLTSCNWISGIPDPQRIYQAQLRYHGKPVDVLVHAHAEGARIQILDGTVATSPGQSLVVYERRDGSVVCRGGGVIA